MSIKKFFAKPAVWGSVLAVTALVIGIVIARGYDTYLMRRHMSEQQKLAVMLGLIDEKYVDKVDVDSLLETLYPDLLSGLDPHSAYIPAKDLEDVNNELEGSFSGIGISFNMLNDTVNVLEVISGGPSEKVGLMAGDRIVTIDDSVASGRKWSNERVIKLLRGPEGTKVKLGIKRSTAAELLPFEVTRGPIPVTSIDAAYMLDPTTAYIKVNKFARNTYDEFLTNMVSLRGDGAKRYIIDLRGNTGGFMEMAILMANEFLPRGRVIVSTKGRTRSSESIAFSDGSGSFKDAEVVVLIDENSASASEIFAGAMQDHDRGLVVGRRSFGKGLVQNQTELPDGSALRLTIARYYTPSGRCIQKTYSHGNTEDYAMEVFNRYDNGELFHGDSIKADPSLIFKTTSGREVYGGGGITPDIFVPADTASVTSYYLKALNAGLFQRFAFKYTDDHRPELSKCKTTEQVLSALPADDDLLNEFVDYAKANGIPARWYYINISRNLIVDNLKALIARSVLGAHAFYEVFNNADPVVIEAREQLRKGTATPPVKVRHAISAVN